jgi:hypothetical protein
MIQAEFYRRNSQLLGFCISGHADAGESGSDIVCAAVSSAAYFAANTITDVIGVKANIAVKSGRLFFKIPEHDAASCSDILKGFRLHLSGLSKQYPKYIYLIDTEVQ